MVMCVSSESRSGGCPFCVFLFGFGLALSGACLLFRVLRVSLGVSRPSGGGRASLARAARLVRVLGVSLGVSRPPGCGRAALALAARFVRVWVFVWGEWVVAEGGRSKLSPGG